MVEHGSSIRCGHRCGRSGHIEGFSIRRSNTSRVYRRQDHDDTCDFDDRSIPSLRCRSPLLGILKSHLTDNCVGIGSKASKTTGIAMKGLQWVRVFQRGAQQEHRLTYGILILLGGYLISHSSLRKVFDGQLNAAHFKKMQGHRLDKFTTHQEYQSWITLEHSRLFSHYGYNERSIASQEQWWVSLLSLWP